MPTTMNAPAAKKGGLGVIDLGAIGKPKASNGKTSYPVHPDPTGDVAKLVPIIRQEAGDLETLKGNLDIHKAELTALALPFYFDTNRSKIDIPSSISCLDEAQEGKAQNEVLVCFTTRFKETTDDAAIIAAMGKEHAEKYVRNSFVIKIDGDLIPAEHAQSLVNELQVLFASKNATAALSAKSVLKPTPAFITERHTIFTPAQNQTINLAMPMVSQIKTKGRK